MAQTTAVVKPRWRSLLYVPVTAERFVEKAHTRGADAILLELEDGVAPSEKERARELVSAAAPRVGQAGADVLVRINRPWRLAVRDIEASVGADVRGLVLPKVDSAEHVRAIAEVVEEVEIERGLTPGHTVFFLRLETPASVFAAKEIADAHPRVVALGLGVGDFMFALGASPASPAIASAAFQVALAAAAADRVAIGLTSSITNFSDLDGFRAVAEHARGMGYRGAPCVHPAQVGVLNDVFSPTAEERAWAETVVAEYEVALANGIGAITTTTGEFVDIPVYEHAKRTLEQASGVER
jgi:citrate lyase subunit beta/citryl-CoA lyase